jgi:Transketolase, thiamine diphosphate binding domain/Glucose-6-phosphate dehydrogenase, C-terminal domain
LDQSSINTIRFLSLDAIQKAASGHLGLPLGAAPMAYVLRTRVLRHKPANPHWEESIFRIDHFLGKQAIMNIPTLSEDLGVEGRGAFCETAGYLRDVIENHLFQIVALLAMEPGGWEPKEADALITADGSWHNPGQGEKE